MFPGEIFDGGAVIVDDRHRFPRSFLLTHQTLPIRLDIEDERFEASFVGFAQRHAVFPPHLLQQTPTHFAFDRRRHFEHVLLHPRLIEEMGVEHYGCLWPFTSGSGIATLWYINNIRWGIGRHHSKRETREMSFSRKNPKKLSFFHKKLIVDQR